MHAVDLMIMRLLGTTGESMGISELAEACGVPVAEIHGRLEALGRAGVEIRRHPHRGCKWIAGPEHLIAEDIAFRLSPDARIGREITVFSETRSTNDVCERMASGGAGEGLVVFAESQSAGRGRLGRTWTSPRGTGLWFSILVRPQWNIAAWSRLTFCAALAVRDAAHQVAGVDLLLKWPNDVVLDQKKIAGILVESRAGTNGFAVVGIGLNVNTESFSGPLAAIASSLRILTGGTYHRASVAAAVLSAFEQNYRMAGDCFDDIVQRCRIHSATLGKWVSVSLGESRVEGLAIGLAESGALIIQTATGQRETVAFGEIEVQCSLPGGLQ